MNLLAAEQRGNHRNDPTPSPPLEGVGAGGEVIKYSTMIKNFFYIDLAKMQFPCKKFQV